MRRRPYFGQFYRSVVDDIRLFRTAHHRCSRAASMAPGPHVAGEQINDKQTKTLICSLRQEFGVVRMEKSSIIAASHHLSYTQHFHLDNQGRGSPIPQSGAVCAHRKDWAHTGVRITLSPPTPTFSTPLTSFIPTTTAAPPAPETLYCPLSECRNAGSVWECRFENTGSECRFGMQARK